ncbi:MAG: homocysteine S-methyltransferase family protein [Lachnospiraceae bacterium]|nr:homocysteine S-methyltransferase family protein [Candidatus Merdinaster equi]
MTKKEFLEFSQNRILLLDGAMGSNLVKAGMPAGVCPEQWICENSEVAIGILQKYVEAGSNIILAPTFSANKIKFSEYGLYDRQKDIIEKLVDTAKKAANGKALVAGDVSMTGIQVEPIGPMKFEELVSIYKEQIQYMVLAGVDVIFVETMMSLQETRAALIAAKEVSDIAVLCSFSFERDGRTLFGSDPVTCALTMQSLGAAAVGANCSCGPVEMAEMIGRMREVVDIPVIAKPNAGLPVLLEDGRTGYSMNAEQFKEALPVIVQNGATLIGGCCGTDATYIQAIYEYVNSDAGVELYAKAQRDHNRLNKSYLSSERSNLLFDTNSPFRIVGERINPTGKKKLQAELLQGSLSMIVNFAEEQEKMGASVLDVNLGLGGIDEKDMMLRALREVTTVSNLPVSIDSSNVDVIEAALREYPGRALINSISLEEVKCRPLFELARRYGAMAILLPLSEEGVPTTFEQRKANIEKLLEIAAEYGLGKKDVFVDPLVMTVGSNPEAGSEIIKTIAYCKEQGIATVCGLSNISFGLPQRSYVNSAFVSMAVANGLTMAIANPSQTMLLASALSADILLNKEGASERFIEFTQRIEEENAAKAAAIEAGAGAAKTDKPSSAVGSDKDGKSGANVPEDVYPYYELVLKGRKNEAESQMKDAISKGIDATHILNDALMPAINDVGALFEKGKYFLPQLISSAETMKNAIAVLTPELQKGNSGRKLPTIVIATVKGDIHDIGKNLVSLMLSNYGFNVIDLGKDVDNELVVDTAVKENAAVIALSALMTTTMTQMKEVVRIVKERKLDIKVVVGGAVVTQDYSDLIGADGYSDSAADCVKLVVKLLNIEV